MADVPQIAFWHPFNADAEDFDDDVSAAYVRLLAPFMQSYPGLTVVDYWQLTVNEHAAMTDWLYATEVLVRPKPQPAADANARAALSKLRDYRDEQGGEGQGGVREPIRPTPYSPAGSAAVEVPA